MLEPLGLKRKWQNKSSSAAKTHEAAAQKATKAARLSSQAHQERGARETHTIDLAAEQAIDSA